MKYYLALFSAALLSFSYLGADEFVTGQAPDVVLGQPDFVSRFGDSKPNRLERPYGVVRDPETGKVFVADSLNSRILRFSSEAAAQNGSNPEAVFGQPNFTSYFANQGGVVGQQTLSTPYQISFDHQGRLWVADFNNNRVVGYYAASYRGSNPYADYVFGQPDYVTDTNGTSNVELDRPTAVFVDKDDTLWIADSGNSRILRIDDVSNKANGAAANGVLGQADFVSASSGTSASKIDTPYALFVDDNGNLWVADTLNHRVLRYDDAKNKGDGDDADGVLGQPDFTTGAEDLAPDRMNTPFGLYVANNGTLFVGDYGNHRILGFKGAVGLEDGADADFALGQSDLVTGVGGTGSIGALQVCEGPDGAIFSADYNNNRVLRYSPFRTPTIRFSRSSAKSKRASYRARGSTDGGPVTTVYYRVGSKSYRTASGTNSWSARARLKKGTNRIQAYAVGPGGTSTIASQRVRYKPKRRRR